MLSAAEVEAELRRLEWIAEALAARYWLPGADRDDVAQIARLGIWRALVRWEGRSSTVTFAWLVARRDVIDALQAATKPAARLHRAALETRAGEWQDNEPELDRAADTGSLFDLVAARAELRAVLDAVPALSELERRSLVAALAGGAYAGGMTPEVKQLDNAARRARAKLAAARSLHVAA